MTNQKIVKRCFIITPIGGERSEVRDALDGLLNNVLTPVLLDAEFEEKNITVAHQMKDSGSINTQLITRIIEDELCIVNLTGLNPNVMYELAIRHAVGKPVIIIAEKGTKLPFDIIDQRTIFYSDTMLGAVHLKEELSAMIVNIFSNPDIIIDNPIIKIIKDNAILDKIKSDGREHSELSLVLNKLSNLEERIVNTEKRKSMSSNKEIEGTRWTLDYIGDLDIEKLKESYWINFEVSYYHLDIKDLKRIQFKFPMRVTKAEINKLMTLIEEQGVMISTFRRVIDSESVLL